MNALILSIIHQACRQSERDRVLQSGTMTQHLNLFGFPRCYNLKMLQWFYLLVVASAVLVMEGIVQQLNYSVNDMVKNADHTVTSLDCWFCPV